MSVFMGVDPVGGRPFMQDPVKWTSENFSSTYFVNKGKMATLTIFQTVSLPTVPLSTIRLRSVGWSTVRMPNIGRFRAILGSQQGLSGLLNGSLGLNGTVGL
jgi:hypothetical protein